MKKIIAGSPVTGKNFIGREKELNAISEYTKLGQNIVLIAPRRFGKTSIILELLNRKKKKGLYGSYVDVFSSPDLGILSENITKAVLENNKLGKIFHDTKDNALSMFKNAKLKATIEDFDFLLEFAAKTKNKSELLNSSINFINEFSKKHKKEIIFAFDEFGDITKYEGENIAKQFRSKIQHHENATYVFSGSYESVMSSLFIRKSAPFFRFAKIIELSYIDKNKFADYYQKVLSDYNISFKDQYITKILDFTRGHPYYSQLVLQEIVIYYLFNKKLPTYNETLKLILESEKNYLEKSWDELSRSQENTKTILAISKGEHKLYSSLKYEGINVSRALNNLKNRGFILSKKDRSVELSDPLLEHWIKTQILNEK
ncbi:MAG: ATP-binding protein [Bacteroidota bacterium]|nr:ATP-binding protein [Bacteroidota bacterium]